MKYSKPIATIIKIDNTDMIVTSDLNPTTGRCDGNTNSTCWDSIQVAGSCDNNAHRNNRACNWGNSETGCILTYVGGLSLD